jgi:hypothetical protein
MFVERLTPRPELENSLGQSLPNSDVRVTSVHPPRRHAGRVPQTVEKRHRRTHPRQKSHLVAAIVQTDALSINHIAPGNRTLAQSA